MRLYLGGDQDPATLVGFSGKEQSAILPVGTFRELGDVAGLSTFLALGDPGLHTRLDLTAAAQTAHQDNFFRAFVTAPLVGGQYLLAGNWTLGLAVRQAGPNANSFTLPVVYLYRANGEVVSIYDGDVPLGNEWPVEFADVSAGRVCTFSSGRNVSVHDGDRLILEVWRHAVQGDAVAHVNSIFYGGNDGDVVEDGPGGDSFLDVPQTLVFQTASFPAPTTSGRNYGKRSVRERWFHCAIGGELVRESETTIPVPPHPQAGLRVCKKDYDEIDYATRRSLTPPPIERQDDALGDF